MVYNLTCILPLSVQVMQCAGPCATDAVLRAWKPTPHVAQSFGDRDGAKADTSRGRGNGSRLYELNLWMWRYGRGQPRKVTVVEAERRRRERTSERRRKAYCGNDEAAQS